MSELQTYSNKRWLWMMYDFLAWSIVASQKTKLSPSVFGTVVWGFHKDVKAKNVWVRIQSKAWPANGITMSGAALARERQSDSIDVFNHANDNGFKWSIAIHLYVNSIQQLSEGQPDAQLIAAWNSSKEPEFYSVRILPENETEYKKLLNRLETIGLSFIMPCCDEFGLYFKNYEWNDPIRFCPWCRHEMIIDTEEADILKEIEYPGRFQRMLV